MNISSETLNGVFVVTVNEDRIDAAAAIKFKDEMKLLTGRRTDDVILNLEKVDFIDSSGLGAIVATKKHIGPDRNMHLAGLTPIVAKVFSLTRMEKVFSIHSDVSKAISSGVLKSA